MRFSFRFLAIFLVKIILTYTLNLAIGPVKIGKISKESKPIFNSKYLNFKMFFKDSQSKIEAHEIPQPVSIVGILSTWA